MDFQLVPSGNGGELRLSFKAPATGTTRTNPGPFRTSGNDSSSVTSAQSCGMRIWFPTIPVPSGERLLYLRIFSPLQDEDDYIVDVRQVEGKLRMCLMDENSDLRKESRPLDNSRSILLQSAQIVKPTCSFREFRNLYFFDCENKVAIADELPSEAGSEAKCIVPYMVSEHLPEASGSHLAERFDSSIATVLLNCSEVLNNSDANASSVPALLVFLKILSLFRHKLSLSTLHQQILTQPVNQPALLVQEKNSALKVLSKKATFQKVGLEQRKVIETQKKNVLALQQESLSEEVEPVDSTMPKEQTIPFSFVSEIKSFSLLKTDSKKRRIGSCAREKYPEQSKSTQDPLMFSPDFITLNTLKKVPTIENIFQGDSRRNPNQSQYLSEICFECEAADAEATLRSSAARSIETSVSKQSSPSPKGKGGKQTLICVHSFKRFVEKHTKSSQLKDKSSQHLEYSENRIGHQRSVAHHDRKDRGSKQPSPSNKSHQAGPRQKLVNEKDGSRGSCSEYFMEGHAIMALSLENLEVFSEGYQSKVSYSKERVGSCPNLMNRRPTETPQKRSCLRCPSRNLNVCSEETVASSLNLMNLPIAENRPSSSRSLIPQKRRSSQRVLKKCSIKSQMRQNESQAPTNREGVETLTLNLKGLKLPGFFGDIKVKVKKVSLQKRNPYT